MSRKNKVGISTEMEDFIKIYLKKEMKYCAACLHTEDVTRLSKMQNYSWIFTVLFTNLYLTEELHDSWVCCWCVRRINNARKLLNDFQAAQNILSKINCMNTSESHKMDEELCFEITKLRNTSELHFNRSLYTANLKNSDANTEFSEKYELKGRFEEVCNDLNNFDSILNEEYDIDSDIGFELDIKSEFRVLRSRKNEKNPKTEKKIKKNAKVKKELINAKKHFSEDKKDLNTEIEVLKRFSNELKISGENNISKDRSKIVKVEYDSEDSAIGGIEKLRLSIMAEIDKVPSINLKSENNDPIINNKKRVEKRREKQKKRPRNYLPHVKRIPCKECDREFTKAIALHNHMIRKHKKKFPCEKCDRVFIKAEYVKTHMAKVHEPKRGIFECAFCGTIYKNRHKMVQHMNKHEKYGPSLKDLENIVCDHCGKLCDRSNIKKHLIKHSEVKNYHCEFCDACFKTPEVREEHTRRKHMDPDVGRRFPCPQCPKKFFTSTQVKYHMTAMHFVQGKPCPVCSKCFATKSKVREHILRVHEKIPAVRDKQCDFCDKAFSTRRQLKHHRYTHTGEKPYKCDICTSAYNQKHCLSVHKLRAHNVEAPKTLIKHKSNAMVTNLHVAGEFSSNVVNWFPLNLNDGRQDLFGRGTSN